MTMLPNQPPPPIATIMLPPPYIPRILCSLAVCPHASPSVIGPGGRWCCQRMTQSFLTGNVTLEQLLKVVHHLIIHHLLKRPNAKRR